MSISKTYDLWADTYDSLENTTRDLEKVVARQTLDRYPCSTVLELGCGTGKNTLWLAEKADLLIAMDFSPQMLRKAEKKITSKNVQFQQSDLTKPWDVNNDSVDLMTCSLVLEHISDLGFIFMEAHKKLKPGGHFYICELHPFKQYSGSKAQFEYEDQPIETKVFVHHISEYINSASENGFNLAELAEWFDDNNKQGIPRLISFVFRK